MQFKQLYNAPGNPDYKNCLKTRICEQNSGITMVGIIIFFVNIQWKNLDTAEYTVDNMRC